MKVAMYFQNVAPSELVLSIEQMCHEAGIVFSNKINTVEAAVEPTEDDQLTLINSNSVQAAYDFILTTNT